MHLAQKSRWTVISTESYLVLFRIAASRMTHGTQEKKRRPGNQPIEDAQGN